MTTGPLMRTAGHGAAGRGAESNLGFPTDPGAAHDAKVNRALMTAAATVTNVDGTLPRGRVCVHKAGASEEVDRNLRKD